MKPWSQSRVLKFNLFMVILSVLSSSWMLYKPFVSDSTFMIVSITFGVVIAVGNIVLRFFTNQPIGTVETKSPIVNN